MNSIEKSNQLAKEMCASGYRYLYGAKGQAYTSELVYELHNLYPKQINLPEALKDADKGYKAIDCSGFLSEVLGLGIMSSTTYRNNAVQKLPVSLPNAREGMAIWKKGHIAYIGEGLKIYEAASTRKDMQVSEFSDRADAFTELLVVKGSALEEVIELEKLDLLEEDGKWGKATTTRLQEIFAELGCNITVDGEVSNQDVKYKDENPGLRPSSWEWCDEPNGRGSKLIRTMQAWAGMPEDERDGEIGPDTIKAFQTKLGTKVDGYVSNPSQMVRALQRWANEQWIEMNK